MHYLEAACIAYKEAQLAHDDVLAEEHRRYADTCALIAIAQELRTYNERIELEIERQVRGLA